MSQEETNMNHSIVLTPGSQRKNRSDIALLRACDRYNGAWINTARELALTNKRPLFFLSAQYGVIEQDQKITHYKALEVRKDLCDHLVRRMIELRCRDVWYVTDGHLDRMLHDACVGALVQQALATHGYKLDVYQYHAAEISQANRGTSGL